MMMLGLLTLEDGEVCLVEETVGSQEAEAKRLGGRSRYAFWLETKRDQYIEPLSVLHLFTTGECQEENIP